MTKLRISQAAELVGVSDDTIRRHVDHGRLSVQTDASNRKVVDGYELARFIQDYSSAAPDRTGAHSSARNRLVGLVTSIVKDTVMAQVEMQCGPHRFVSLISTEAVEDLGLEPGTVAVASVKSTNVTIETP